MARGKSNDNAEILEYALKHLEKERDEIQVRIESIRRQLAGGRFAGSRKSAPRSTEPLPAQAGSNGEAPRKRVLSDAARKRIAAAQKKRWAEHRKQLVKTA